MPIRRQGVRPDARAQAHPRGGVERSETAVSEEMAKVRLGMPIRRQGVRPDARAQARPRGGVERSETAVSEEMVGGTGLEPVTPAM